MTMLNQSRRAALVLLFAASLGLQAGAAEKKQAPKRQPKYVYEADVDWRSIVSDPPAAGSEAYQRDIDELLRWQKERTAEDRARCLEVASGSGFYFHHVLGSWFNRKSLPHTAELLDQVNTDANRISEAAKRNWRRPRPYQADERIKPCVVLEATASYPSGHATRGIVWASVLAEMFPEHREALMAKGKQFGDDRVVSGVHYPSDVAAAQKLGAEIAKKLLAKPEFQKDLERAKEECLAAPQGKR